MAKQTLFEAEAVLTANTSGMLADIDYAVAQARQKLNTLSGYVNLFGRMGGGGGGSGGGGGGGSSNPINQYYRLNMELAKQATIVGDLARAQRLYAAIEQSTLYTAEQINRTKTTRLRLEQRINAAAQKNSGVNPFGVQGPQPAPGFVPPFSFGNPGGLQGPYMASGNFVSNFTGAGGGTGSGRGNGLATAQFANASYALQDFITVLSMGGGFQRALLSASNNIGFMAGMLGTASGAFIGVGAVLGSVLIPKLYELALGMDEASVVAERFKDRIAKLAEEMKLAGERRGFGFELADLRKEAIDFQESGKPASARQVFKDAIRDADRERSIKRSELSEGETEAKEVRARTIEDFYRNVLGRDPGKNGEKLFRRERDWINGVIEGRISAEDVRNGNTPVGAGGNKTTWNKFAESLRDINDPLDKTQKEIDVLTENLNKLKEAAKKSAEEAAKHDPNNPENWTSFGAGQAGLPAGFGPNPMGGPGMWLGGQSFGQAAGPPPGFSGGRFNPSTPLSWATSRKSAIDGFLSEFAPKEAEIAKVKDNFAHLVELFPDKESSFNALRDAQIKKIRDRADSGISGTFGASNFASQLTNQLLKTDPQKELVELARKQPGLLTDLLGDRSVLVSTIKGLNPSPFGP